MAEKALRGPITQDLLGVDQGSAGYCLSYGSDRLMRKVLASERELACIKPASLTNSSSYPMDK